MANPYRDKLIPAIGDGLMAKLDAKFGTEATMPKQEPVADLVERLRKRCAYGDARLTNPHDPLAEEAASALASKDAEIAALRVERDDALERAHYAEGTADAEAATLREQVKGMREALEPFAEFARASSFDKLPDDVPLTNGSPMARKQVTAADFRRARNLLETKTDG